MSDTIMRRAVPFALVLALGGCSLAIGAADIVVTTAETAVNVGATVVETGAGLVKDSVSSKSEVQTKKKDPEQQ